MIMFVSSIGQPEHYTAASASFVLLRMGAVVPPAAPVLLIATRGLRVNGLTQLV